MDKKRRKGSNQKTAQSSSRTAQERIGQLFEEARNNYKSRQDLADRYAQLARKLSLKYKVRFSKEQKMQFCKQCGSYLMVGHNAFARASGGKLLIHCKACGSRKAFVYKP